MKKYVSRRTKSKNNNYIFSIIMSVYNVEKYIEESIESLINQTFPFEKVQLIIVNDGSKDNSKDICLKYASLYQNIEYYEKENGGLSSARNFGLQYVKGQFVNFLDPDDTISELALEKVNEFFNSNSNINLVGLVVKYFENATGIHPRYLKFEKETTIVDLEESPQNYILSSAATFYRAHLFENRRYDTNLEVAEDLYFNCQIYLENSVFGVISSDEAVYNYRIRKTNTSLTNINRYDADRFIFITDFLYKNFKRILKEQGKEMPEFLKYILIGEIIKRNKALNSLGKEKLSIFHNICKKILSDIDPETIRKFSSENHMLKIALLTLKYGWESEKIEFKVIDNRLYANSVKVGIMQESPLILSNVDFKEDKIIVEGVYNDIIPLNQNISLRFKDSDFKPYEMTLTETDNEFYLNKTLGITFNKAYQVKCELPLINTEYTPFIKIAGMDIKVQFKNFYKFSLYEKFVRQNEPFCLFSKKKILKIDNNSFNIMNKKLFSEISYEVKKQKYIANKFSDIDCFRNYNKKKKKYILINDRPMVANDNGQAMFEYINKYQKKYAKNTYYVISKESSDYEKLCKIGNVVESGSAEHKKMFINSKIIISSHANFYNPFNETETLMNRDILKYKFLFLQHGVIINNVHKPLNRPKSGIDWFVTSTEKERKEILSPKYMFEENNVILTGLPRFDKLKNNKEKLIVISPTWRTFLSGPINKDGFHDPIEGFDQSEYFKNWTSLLKNEKLLKKCRDENYKILFILHPGFKNYFDFFKSYINDIVSVEHAENIVYSKIFNTLSLLITDYSSIMFDVAYLKKPIIFYQFDQDMYFSKHYKPGYFSYEKDGFGAVVKKEKEVEKLIMKYFENGFQLEKEYVDIIENTFKYIDNNNCQRVFDSIIDYLK